MEKERVENSQGSIGSVRFKILEKEDYNMKRQGTILWPSICLVLALAVLVVCTNPMPTQAQVPRKQEKITLRLIYEEPITDLTSTVSKAWVDKVNASAPGRVEIKYLGAQEVIPAMQQFEAVKKGTVDMAYLAPLYYTGLVPEGMVGFCLGYKATVPEQRKMGLIALQDQIHRAKAGVAVLGVLWNASRHVVLLKKQVNKADLTGLKIRAVPVQKIGVEVMGGVVIQVPRPDVYVGLQKGLFEGTATPAVQVRDYREYEVTNYWLSPLFPTNCWVPIIVNASVWDRLPEDVKKIIMDPLLEIEQKVDPYYKDQDKEAIAFLEGKGLKKCGATSQAEIDDVSKRIAKTQWKTWIEERADAVWLPKINAISKPILGID